jgi:hypothetical protein
MKIKNIVKEISKIELKKTKNKEESEDKLKLNEKNINNKNKKININNSILNDSNIVVATDFTHLYWR